MIIAIDAGNTRIKWGVFDGEKWISLGVLSTSNALQLTDVSVAWPERAPVVACNVAGPSVETAIDASLSPRAPILWLRSSTEACGVWNSYESPLTLGSDRWAALIGARKLTRGPCLVVCAGTATTIDWLDASGVFRGGLILPGLELMYASLANNTVQLPLVSERHPCREPRNTQDAIVNGCLQAQIGAIEKMFARMHSNPAAICLMTGGAAKFLAPHLEIPSRVEENMILDGLVHYNATVFQQALSA
ncbi:MAG: type III pantothenate kinase [Candidatus Accumulibacter sp.]|jgi:type III pantothenate kinase|nr:type III pantothenate kinase [Accumulibacter sp.]